MSDGHRDATEGKPAAPPDITPTPGTAFQKSNAPDAPGKIDALKKQLQEEEKRKTAACLEAVKAICAQYGRTIVAQPVILPNGTISANVLIIPEPQEN